MRKNGIRNTKRCGIRNVKVITSRIDCGFVISVRNTIDVQCAGGNGRITCHCISVICRYKIEIAFFVSDFCCKQFKNL